MASASRILLVAFLLATASTMAAAQKAAPAPAKAKAAPAAPVADAPGAATADGKPPPTDPIAILKKAGGFNTFCDLLEQSRVDTQLKAQLTDSYNGLTIFAPTDAAFDALKAGTLNGLSNQDQIQMMLYCVLPRFYSLSMLGTIKDKVNTQASGHSGPYKYSIKPSGNNVNVSTGVKGNNMLLNSVVSKDFPLSIYSVDKVPLPYELFGPQPPTPAPSPAPAPAPAKSKKKKKKAADIAEEPTSDDDTTSDETKNAASSLTGRWVAALGVLAAAVLGGAF